MLPKPDIVILNSPNSSGNWQPVIGQETQDLLDYFGPKLDDGSRSELQASSLRIASKCIDPRGPDKVTTGLVVGYVQSGKTMSFTMVTALAVDNGYPLVIVITGTTKPLFEQSNDRLHRDLRLESRMDRKWQHLKEPDQRAKEQLGQILEEWRDPDVPQNERQFVLITVKKNWSVLKKLIALLNLVNRTGIPALIIDDEADQASLNTRVRQDEESPTYSRLLQLRDLFPKHTFLQYTATPQAPLLISILDSLSPDFAELIYPGGDYVGGIEFFDDQTRRVLRITDILPQVPLTEPPASLIEALRYFFVGVAAGLEKAGSGPQNRSMFIHPSRETDPHNDFHQWVRSIKGGWVEALGLPPTDTDYQEEVEAFHAAYAELATSVGIGIPSWDSVRARLLRAIRKTNIVEVNATPRRGQVDWKSCYAWILVGGQALDRGFTIEGLTVTYMPRGVGTGNADTLQQRARFFGYKRQYFGYCRVYLDPTVADAFYDYIRHEENVRKQLEEWRNTDRPVNEWKRAFLLDSSLQPTRSNVLSLDHARGGYEDDWFWIRCPHDPTAIISENRNLFDKLISSHRFLDIPGHEHRPSPRQHRIAENISLEVVYREFLAELRTSTDDGQEFFGVLLQIREHLKSHPNASCNIYQVSFKGPRERAVNEQTDEIDQLFSGSNKQPSDIDYDPGDRALRADGVLCLQLHRLNLTKGGSPLENDVPVLAIWVPAKMQNDWLVQNPTH